MPRLDITYFTEPLGFQRINNDYVSLPEILIPVGRGVHLGRGPYMGLMFRQKIIDLALGMYINVYFIKMGIL